MQNRKATALIIIILAGLLLFETLHPAGFLYSYFNPTEESTTSSHKKRKVPPIAVWYAGNYYEGSFISDQPDDPLHSKLWSRNNVNLKDVGNMQSAPSWKWHTDLGENHLYPQSQPLIGDIDKDGIVEIIVIEPTSGHGFIRCFNGLNGTQKWVSQDIPYLNKLKITMFDIDQDGYIEILATVSQATVNKGLWCFNHNGTVRWHSDIDTMYSSVCYDIDNDGQIEIIVAGGNALYCFNNEGTLEWSKPITQPVNVIIADINSDGLPEIITHSSTSTAPGYIYYLNYKGETLKTITFEIGAIYPLCAADVNGDGKMEVLYYARYTSAATTRNIGLLDSDGNLLWTYDTGYGLDIHVAAVYDVNDDGYAEIFLAGKYTAPGEILALKHDGTKLWNYTTIYQTESGVVLADINGDGKLEAMFCSRDGKIRCFNAASGDLLWSFDNAGILRFNIAVADVDNDGLAEIVYGGGDNPSTNWFRIAVLE